MRTRRRGGGLWRIRPSGEERVVARNVDVSDMAVTAKSTIYFSDAVHKTIGSVDGLGRVRVVYQGGEICMPRGVALSGDQAMLVVSDAQGRFSWSFQIAANGRLRMGSRSTGWRRPRWDGRAGCEGWRRIRLGRFTLPRRWGCRCARRMGGWRRCSIHRSMVGCRAWCLRGRRWTGCMWRRAGSCFGRPVKVTGVAAGMLVKLPKPPL